MKYRELTREEARDLFELGAPVESRHQYVYNFPGAVKFDWEEWGSASEARLEETRYHLDEFRIAVE